MQWSDDVTAAVFRLPWRGVRLRLRPSARRRGAALRSASARRSKVHCVVRHSKAPSVAGRRRVASMAGRSRVPFVAGRSRVPFVAGRSRVPFVAGRSRVASTAGRSRVASVGRSPFVVRLSREAWRRSLRCWSCSCVVSLPRGPRCRLPAAPVSPPHSVSAPCNGSPWIHCRLGCMNCPVYQTRDNVWNRLYVSFHEQSVSFTAMVKLSLIMTLQKMIVIKGENWKTTKTTRKDL